MDRWLSKSSAVSSEVEAADDDSAAGIAEHAAGADLAEAAGGPAVENGLRGREAGGSGNYVAVRPDQDLGAGAPVRVLHGRPTSEIGTKLDAELRTPAVNRSRKELEVLAKPKSAIGPRRDLIGLTIDRRHGELGKSAPSGDASPACRAPGIGEPRQFQISW
jgi:hypothetical protein